MNERINKTDTILRMNITIHSQSLFLSFLDAVDQPSILCACEVFTMNAAAF